MSIRARIERLEATRPGAARPAAVAVTVDGVFRHARDPDTGETLAEAELEGRDVTWIHRRIVGPPLEDRP